MKPNDFAASIVADARKRASEIDRGTKEEIKAYKVETQRLVSQKQAKLAADVKREEEQERNRVEAKRHLEATIATLTTKQRLIDAAFTQAAEELARMPKPEREKILERLWKDATSQIKVGRIEVSERDAAFFKGKADTTVMSCIGGFVAHTEDGLVSVDFTFETILETVRQRKLKEISDALFGGTL